MIQERGGNHNSFRILYLVMFSTQQEKKIHCSVSSQLILLFFKM